MAARAAGPERPPTADPVGLKPDLQARCSGVAAAVKHLTRILSRTVGDTAIVSVQDPILLDPHTEPQPDLALLRPREDFYKTAHPRASDVFEVADTSLRYDREIKILLYARHGIPEVWRVDLLNNRIRLFREGTAEGYRRESEAADLERARPPAPAPGDFRSARAVVRMAPNPSKIVTQAISGRKIPL